jgi:hypothetical protein
MTAERTYSDNEVALILRRAMAMQPDAAGRGERGLSLAELREIAREIGIDPDLVSEAASQLPTAGDGLFGRFFGVGMRQDLRLVHPAELSRDQLQNLTMVIRSTMQQQGRAHEVLDALEWTTVGDVSQVAVTIRAGGGRTTVQVMVDRTGAALLTMLGPVFLGAFAGAITGSIVEPGVAGGIAIMSGGLAGGVLMARAIWQRNTRAFQRKLARLTEGIRQVFDS